MSEKSVLNKLQLLASSLGHRLFRNNNGMAYSGEAIELDNGSILIKNPYRIKYGLGVGTGDLVGGTQIKVTPEMIGKTILVFTNYEVKMVKTKVTKEQTSFHNTILQLGGISIIERFKSTDIEDNSYVKTIARFQRAE